MLNVLIVYAVSEEKVNVQMPNCIFHYCRTGVGKVSAAIAVEASIEKYQPEIVINIGTAGSVEYQVGSIHLCKKFIDRDMEKLQVYGVPFKEDFTDDLRFLPFFKDWNFDSVCNTGDSFLTSTDGNGDIFDMESFAVAKVCRKHKVPFIGVKYVTDKIGENSVKHWEDKLSEAQSALQEFMDTHSLKVPENYIGSGIKNIIDQYQLQEHPEGGWYREMYRSKMMIENSSLGGQFKSDKSVLTSIYYMLADNQKSVFHKIKSPEIWCFHQGMPLIIHEITIVGEYISTELSNEEEGLLQYTVEPGNWFAAELKNGYGYSLVSCAVAPGFDFEDFELAQKEELIKNYSHLSNLIERLS